MSESPHAIRETRPSIKRAKDGSSDAGHLKSKTRWVVGGYAFFATFWILFSDHALGALITDPELLLQVSVYKGLGFVAFTSLLLLFLMRWAFGEIKESYLSLMAHEVEIERLKRLYAALSQINQAIVWTQARDDLLRKICTVLVEHGGLRMAWIGWHDPETRMLVPLAECGCEKDWLQNLRTSTDGPAGALDPHGRAFREGRHCICNDLQHDPAMLSWRSEAIRRGLHASAIFPITMNDEVRGTLNVYAKEAAFFQDQEIALLAEAAVDISFSLGNLAREEGRKKAEAVARREQLFSATMIESMPGIVFFYDSQGRFLRWNQNFTTVSGYSTEEIAHMRPPDFFADEDKPLLKARINEVFATGESFIEAPFRTRDGRLIPYLFTGRRLVFDGTPCLVGVGIDMTARKQGEETQRRLAAIVNSSDDAIIGQTLQGIITSWNPGAIRMFGHTAEEVIGQSTQMLFPPDRLDEEPELLAGIERGEFVRNFETIRVRKDGTRIDVSVTLSPITDGQGNVIGASKIARDITKRKLAERALVELNESLELKVEQRTEELSSALERAESADRLKSAFLATMSHELRTPLNSIIGFTGILLQGLAGDLNTEQSKQLAMVRSSARHLLELINDVLDLSKIEAGQLEMRSAPFDLDASIERVAATVRPLVEGKNLTLTTHVAANLGQMTGDQRRVDQILLNLLNNALKFTDRGGVTLTASLVEDFKASPEAAPRPAVRICVKDTGIGIKPEDLGSLFQPFRQIDSGLARLREGTGLGLTICRRLIKLMKGDISVTSEWAKGSIFTVTLPLQPHI